MTHCNKFQHTFTSIKNKKIELNFAAGVVSSDGGAMLLGEAYLKLGLISGICNQLIDPRHLIDKVILNKDSKIRLFYSYCVGEVLFRFIHGKIER